MQVAGIYSAKEGKRGNVKEIIDVQKVIQVDLLHTEYSIFYLYTPLCGTCQIASPMVTMLEQLFPSVVFYRVNINTHKKLAQDWKITSVPCLIIYQRDREVARKYAFESVPDLYSWLQSLSIFQ